MVGTASNRKPFNVKLEMTASEARLIQRALQSFDTSLGNNDRTQESLRQVIVQQLRDILA